MDFLGLATSVVTEYWPYILGAFLAIAAYLNGRASGKDAVIKEVQEEALEQRDRIDEAGNVARADGASKRLHDGNF